jgi:CheY-like chemotaxis protein
MSELLKQFIDVLKANLGMKSIGLLTLCLCAVYMWYQHFRNKILKDQVEFEKQRKEDFLKEVEELRKKPNPHRLAEASREHVLVVDDERMVCELVADQLQGEDPSIEVEIAADGYEALDKVARKKPSILITDIVMPRMNGIDLLKILQTKGIRIPTLVVSGYYGEEFLSLLSSEGIAAGQRLLFLSKPIVRDDLRKALEVLRRPETDKMDSSNSDAPDSKKRCR